ncbi:translation initiation factor IF-2 [Dryobates pubescens]|uniref:translation initiation factor IF-2 n=1 Tax=Dryobates pubescens TaxID=118200 RepID=UPI0023B9CCA1|nr:translation initiation factor IF-2 [Dryobates pubescens]
MSREQAVPPSAAVTPDLPAAAPRWSRRAREKPCLLPGERVGGLRSRRGQSQGRQRPAVQGGERPGCRPAGTCWLAAPVAHRCDAGFRSVTPFPSSPRASPFSSGPVAAVQPWPSPRTTPRTTSPGNGTEMASRSPDPIDTNLSKGLIPSF